MSKPIVSYKQTTLDEQWDVIVVGSGPGGLGAAAVLAKEGKRVLVLEQHYVAGGFTHVFKRKGYEWDVGLHYIGEVNREQSMMRRMFDYVSDSQTQWADMGDVYDRIRFGDDEFPLRCGTDAFREDLIQWFPNESNAIDTYIRMVLDAGKAYRMFLAEKAMPKMLSSVAGTMMRKGFAKMAKRTTLDVLSELTRDKLLIGVLCGQWGDYGLPPAESSFGMHAILVRHYLRGGAYPIGGAGVIADHMASVIHAAGGLVVTKAAVESINVEKGKAIGVTIADGRRLVAPIVISGAGYMNTVQHLLPPAVAEAHGMTPFTDRIPRSGAHVCLYLGFKQNAEALNMPKANHWLYPESPDHDENVHRFLADRSAPLPLTYISFPSAKDPDWDNRYPERSTVEAITLSPYEWFAQWEETRWMKRGDDYLAFKQEFTERLLEELFRVEPQLKGHVDYSELSTPLSTAHFSGHRKGEIYGLEHSPERFSQRHLQPRTPIQGLFLTGQDVSTAGVTGALVGGFLTASAITKKNLMDRI
ncbi:MAG: FAD-dependent oxidoreductase [Deltaproteobacteria bacterium]|nr:FAD-dependent oxidoreductase [Deltaproteobacteria bacterium]